MSLDRRIFFDRIRPLFGGRLTQLQVEGMDAILNSWERRAPGSDLRWLAYLFATAFHETARTMQPVREAFWLSEDWRRRNLRYYPYYGRGYVQLTWPQNYARAGAFVGADLVRNPDLAMLPEYAATILFVGTEAGWFRGDARGRHTLARYFNRNVNDPVGAREIINGREFKTINGRRVLLATVIAEYHAAFLQAVTAAARASVRAPGDVEMPHARSFDAVMMTEDLVAGQYSLSDQLMPELAFADFADAEIAAESPAATMFSDEVAPPFEDGPQDALNGEQNYLVDRTVEIVMGYLASSNRIDQAELPGLITGVHRALAGLSIQPLDVGLSIYAMAPEMPEDMVEATDPPKAAAARKRSRPRKAREYQDGPAPEHA